MAKPRALAATSARASRAIARFLAAPALAALSLTVGLALMAPPAAQAQLKWGIKPELKTPSPADNAPDKVAADRAQAEAGKAEGQYALGARYLEGKGVPRDYAEART